MLKRDYAGQLCSIARTLELIGERWTLLIVRDAFLGVRRFDDFQRSLGIARNVLATRLERLVAEGIFERAVYSEHPPRHEYRLTEKGRDLNVSLAALRQWGDTHLGDAPVHLRRRSDKRPVVAALVPEGSRDVLGAREVEVVDRQGRPVARST